MFPEKKKKTKKKKRVKMLTSLWGTTRDLAILGDRQNTVVTVKGWQLNCQNTRMTYFYSCCVQNKIANILKFRPNPCHTSCLTLCKWIAKLQSPASDVKLAFIIFSKIYWICGRRQRSVWRKKQQKKNKKKKKKKKKKTDNANASREVRLTKR